MTEDVTHPGATLPGRRCQRCGAVMPRRMWRQRDPRGLLACPSCQRNEGQPEWVGDRVADLTGAELDELGRRMAEAQRSIRACRGRRSAWDVRRHLMEGHGWSEQTVDAAHPSDLDGLHFGLHDAADAGKLMQPVHTHETRTPKLAHESEDNSSAMHCPFCGSGQVIGNSDGSISCGYCESTFTIRSQPQFAAMPQTVDGVPYGASTPPGQPGQTLATLEGRRLPLEVYLRHLALRHAADPVAVLHQITTTEAPCPSGPPAPTPTSTA